MKRIVVILTILCIFLAPVQVFAEEAVTKPGDYEAKSVVLAETVTGQILFQQNGEERLPIASVTKIMTLLIAAEEISAGHLSMEDKITASAHASSMDGSVIWLEQGEEMSVYDIIRSVVISSANDACVALAEAIAGSEEAFVARMNQRALELGMDNTHFLNCTGLDDNIDKGHYSTARDVAIMAAQLRKYDYFDEFLSTRLTYVREGTGRETQLLNTNKLINKYEGITGLKTGTTDKAGYCFVATARRGDMELVAVVLGAKDENERFQIAQELLDYGFNSFQLFSPDYDPEKMPPVPVERGVTKEINVYADQNIYCIIPKGRAGDVTYLYDLPKSVTAPVAMGQRVGKIIALLGDDTLFVTEINARESAEELTLWKSFQLLVQSFFSF